VPLDGYRSRPPDEPEPPRRFEIDEVSWGLVCMTVFAALRIFLGVIHHEGASADVARAIAIALATSAAAVYRIVKTRPGDPPI
jgi:hypothetical protein